MPSSFAGRVAIWAYAVAPFVVWGIVLLDRGLDAQTLLGRASALGALTHLVLYLVLVVGPDTVRHLLAGDRLRRRRVRPSARPDDPRLAAACWTQTDHADVVAGHAWVHAAHRVRRANPPLDLSAAALLAPAVPLRTSVCPACLTINDAPVDSVACSACGTATMRPARILSDRPRDRAGARA